MQSTKENERWKEGGGEEAAGGGGWEGPGGR